MGNLNLGTAKIPHQDQQSAELHLLGQETAQRHHQQEDSTVRHRILFARHG